MNLTQLTIAELQAGYRDRKFSCTEVVTAYQEQIAKRDGALGAILRQPAMSLDQAKEVDQRLASGSSPRPLEGVPVAIKDNLTMTGEIATAGSRILENYRAPYTATSVQRLIDAGAVPVARTNLDEFAMGTSTETSAFQPTKNPWDTKLVPGGSSGGSAVAVAADFAVGALGSDTGGSIRQPAAFCNVVGFKPTYGRISRYGLIALASSLDQVGPFTRTVEDAARMYQVMAGFDPCDLTTRREPPEDVLSGLSKGVADMKIGLPKEFFGEGVDPEIAEVVQAAAKVYEEAGATLVEVSIPHAPLALATYYIIQPAEASSNLARFDGIRYGLSVREAGGLSEIYRHTRAQGFGAEVKRRIMIGTFSLSAGYADAYYHQANRVRAMLREEFHRAFDQVDVLLTPTSPTVAFPLQAKIQDPLTMYLADLLTVPANLANIPAISIPTGFVHDLPVGLQLMGREWDEATLLRAAAFYQSKTDWHTRRPA